MTTLSKAAMAEKLSVDLNITKTHAKQFIELFFKELAEALCSGCNVKLTGFGAFKLRDKAGRPGRNPKTGEEVEVTPRRVVTFRASTKLREKIAENFGESGK